MPALAEGKAPDADKPQGPTLLADPKAQADLIRKAIFKVKD